ncbi:MAG: PAS domain-containing protein [Burkholderiales bacterium]|nr:PAS domain-containing protein [Burkholderiales bacterium]
MNPVLQTLLDNVSDGLLWANANGEVTFANQKAQTYCGMKSGDRLPDSPMARAVAVIASGKLKSQVRLEFEPQAGCKQLLVAEVGPGMAQGEAWIYLKSPAPYGEALSLNNLMTVIRSDLATPLKRLTSVIKSAIESDSLEASKEGLQKVSEVTDTVIRLTELAQLWGHQDLLASDRLELWPLLKCCWLQQEHQALAKKITVRLVSRFAESEAPIVYASEFWLTRIVTESLGAALRAVPTGGTLDIELRQMGPRVLIVFRNSGMWPMRQDDATLLADPNAQPQTSDRSKSAARPPAPPPPNAKDLIGLHLCQCIVGLHGGQLREEDEDGLRNFLIDLPTGAPYRSMDQSMDAAQAQRYAADLAVLMSRRRQKAA